MNDLKIFSGRANPELAQRICEYLGLPLGKISMGNFPDGEISCKIDEDVRGRDVFLMQPTCPPVNENLMELLIMIDSFKRASAFRVTAVIPYFGYARQDRKDAGRVPITAKLVANIITRAGAREIHVAATHGLLVGPAIERLEAAPISSVALTDTIPLRHKQQALPKIRVLSVAALLGQAIKRIHRNESVSGLFV